MSDYAGPGVVTQGLAICFDAANGKSYPGAGSVWYNLGYLGGSVTGQTYTPAYTRLGGVTCFNFNQVGAYFQNNNIFPASFPTDRTNLTISVWFYPAAAELSAGDRGNLVRANNSNAFYMSWNKSTQQQSNYYYGKTNEGYHESGAAITRGTWNNIVAVWTATELKQWLNNVKTTAATSGTAGLQTSGLQIGWEADSRQFSGGIAIIHIYDRALQDWEVQQCYYALRPRFGLASGLSVSGSEVSLGSTMQAFKVAPTSDAPINLSSALGSFKLLGDK